MPKLSVTIITKDEESDIGGAIESVSWADEIVVVDSHSTDRTVDIARSANARVVVIVRDWPGYIEQKNYAAEQAAHDWIFSLERRGISVVRDVCRDGAAAVLKEYAEDGGEIYNARQGE